MMVSGSIEHLDNDIELLSLTDVGTQVTSWKPSSEDLSSRASEPKTGSRIMNEGSAEYGYFLGNIDPGTGKSSHSTLDNYMTEDDLEKSSVKDKPAYPGSTDIEFDLTIESRWTRDANGTNGDEMLYGLRVRMDYDVIEILNELVEGEV